MGNPRVILIYGLKSTQCTTDTFVIIKIHKLQKNTCTNALVSNSVLIDASVQNTCLPELCYFFRVLFNMMLLLLHFSVNFHV